MTMISLEGGHQYYYALQYLYKLSKILLEKSACIFGCAKKVRAERSKVTDRPEVTGRSEVIERPQVSDRLEVTERL